MSENLEASEATQRADDDYGPFSFENSDLMEALLAKGAAVREIVPRCVGLSLSLVEEGLTFTLVASGRASAVLDATQYLGGGPCVDAVNGATSTSTQVGAVRDHEYPLFSTTAQRLGVRSSFSLPIIGDDGVVVGGFNLYGSCGDAFVGKEEQVAEVLGGWADEAIINRDLGFHTFDLARRAPEILRNATRLSMASGMLMRSWEVPASEAEASLRLSALRARLPLDEMVDCAIEALTELEEIEVGLRE